MYCDGTCSRLMISLKMRNRYLSEDDSFHQNREISQSCKLSTPKPTNWVKAQRNAAAELVLSICRQRTFGLARDTLRAEATEYKWNLFTIIICPRFQDQSTTWCLGSGTKVSSHMSRRPLQASNSSVSSTNSFRKPPKSRPANHANLT